MNDAQHIASNLSYYANYWHNERPDLARLLRDAASLILKQAGEIEATKGQQPKGAPT